MGEWLTSKDDARCPECGHVEYLHGITTHECPALFYVGIQPDNFERIYAHGPKEAVFEWAWRYVDKIIVPGFVQGSEHFDVTVSDGRELHYFVLITTVSRHNPNNFIIHVHAYRKTDN